MHWYVRWFVWIEFALVTKDADVCTKQSDLHYQCLLESIIFIQPYLSIWTLSHDIQWPLKLEDLKPVVVCPTTGPRHSGPGQTSMSERQDKGQQNLEEVTNATRLLSCCHPRSRVWNETNQPSSDCTVLFWPNYCWKDHEAFLNAHALSLGNLVSNNINDLQQYYLAQSIKLTRQSKENWADVLF